MSWLAGLVAVLVLLGSVLAVAEASISRMTKARAVALHREGLRNAALLERIERDPAPYLNAIYLTVMFAQNGSAIVVALLAEHWAGDLGVTVASVVFTFAYFVAVEAMSKTYGILHSDRAAAAVAPFVWVLGRLLSPLTRLLIGISNVLLPGKGLQHGPFVEQEIYSLVEAGHEEGVIEETEKKMIHSVFRFGDVLVREVMTPRPDIVAIDVERSLRDAHALAVEHGVTRLPAYRGDLEHTEGIVHAKDILAALLEGRHEARLTELLRPAHFAPETKRATALLREMQAQKFHQTLVVDEYGTVSGLVALEDLLEELVGDIAEEHETAEREIEPLGDGRYRVDASVTIAELNDVLGADLPDDRWNTVGGLLFGSIGAVPSRGQSVSVNGLRLTAEEVRGRRVTWVLVAPARDRPAS